jgi:hypothetical protein
MKRAANYWPTETQTLLLRAGLLSGDEALRAWHRVEPGLDLSRLDQASQRLLPLVYANLRRHGASARRLAELGDGYRAAWLWNQRLFQRAAEIVEALERAGIPSIVLKGLALVMTCYRDVGARPMGDIDVLVPAALAVPAAGVLSRSGWAPRYALTPAFLSVKHAAPFDGGGGEECDLHWRVFEEAGEAAADDAWWATSITIDFRGARFGLLCPTDQLLHVCIHGAKWTWSPAIRWVADALLIVRAGGIDWPRLVAQARARRFTLRMRETLCYLSTAMGAAIPAETLEQLSRLPLSPLERLEYRVQSREHRLLGELPTYWCNYLRARPGGMLRPLGFARYLQRAWALESPSDVPRRALALAAQRLRTRSLTT